MTPRTRLDRAQPVSRRAAVGLGLGAGVTVLSGCALNNPFGSESTPAARAVRNLAPDVAVAVEAATAIRRTASAVSATTARHPDLGGRLAGLTQAHAAHLDAVVRAVPDGVDTSSQANGPAYVVPPRPARALTRLTDTEAALHDNLVGLAIRAQSGPFARLLGAMAAAISQQLHELAR
jgi:hypothetical protein